MKRRTLTLLLVASMAGSSLAQQVPKEVQQMIDGYIQDSTGPNGLINAQRFLGVSPSLRSADIQVGKPLEAYDIRWNAMDTCRDDMPLQGLLVPANTWTFAVRAHGEYIYDVDIVKGKDGKWRWSRSGELKANNWWDELRKTYPESSGIDPIIIQVGGSKYLYFPQKPPFNLFLVKYGNERGDFGVSSSNSMDSLDDSRQFTSFLKKHWKDSQPSRDAYIKKHPGFSFETMSRGGAK